MEGQEAHHSEKPSPPKAIVCLHAQRDASFYRELQTYLAVWQTQGQIYWAEQTAIAQADLILLLLTPTFLATKRCQKAMVTALQEADRRGVLVVPLLARVSHWKESACGRFQALPRNERPIAEWKHKERAYETISADLAQLLPGLSSLGLAHAERPRLFQARDLPEGYVPRPNVFDAIKQHLLVKQGSQTTAITTALRGTGGFGKTTLALALCHDPEIQAAFPDGILWVQLTEQPHDPLDLLNRILHALEPSLSKSVTLEEAQDCWRRALAERECLLVIDDVWQKEVLKPLLEGGPHCKRLVTTRNDQVLPEDVEHIRVDVMESAEAITLLCQGLPDGIQQTASQFKLESLVRRLGCWPILLTLARGLIAERVRRGRTLDQTIEIVEQAYHDRGVTAFDVSRATTRHQAVQASIEVSLRHFEEFLPERYQARERYKELAVFPEDTFIPLSTLQIFWQTTGRLKQWETEDLCLHLHRLSLLTDCNLEAGTIRLHDVLRSYLIQRAGEQLPPLHQRLLDAHQQHYHLTRWADLPQSETYLWQQLIFHLSKASDRETLQHPCTDLLYLTRKVVYMGFWALEADLNLASSAQAGEKASLSSVATLALMIRSNNHLLHQVTSEAEVGGLLLNQLQGEMGWDQQRLELELDLPRPCFAGWHPLPDYSPFVEINGDISPVEACGFSPDGKRIVSTSYDGTLKVWDSTTGTESFTLAGHTSPVTGCGYSPNGRWIASSSEDHTLKVWDATTGREVRTLSGHTSLVNACKYSPDGKWIASASSDRTLKVWDSTTGAEHLTLSGHTSRISACGFSPDGRRIVSASWGGTLKVWDSTTGAERLSLRGHTSSVNACGFSPDGQWIVSASADRTLKVWDSTTGTESFTLIGHTSPVTGCEYSPNGRWIVSASSDQTLKVWDAVLGHCMLTFPVKGWLFDCAFHPDGEHLAACGRLGMYFLRLVQ